MIPVYVVHSPRLRERRAHLAPVLQRFGWVAQWVEAFDPADIPPEVIVAARRPALTRAEISVYLKHLEVFREVLRQRHEAAFVLEDDAVFSPDFPAQFAEYRAALPRRFDLACFGASTGLEVPGDPKNPRFGRERGTRSMSGNLFSAAGCSALLDALEGTPIADPIDLSANRVIRERGLQVYWSVPALVQNGTETGLFAHSLGVRWRQRTLLGRLSRAYGTLRRRLRGPPGDV